MRQSPSRVDDPQAEVGRDDAQLPAAPRGRAARTHLLAFCGYLGAACAMLWPLPLRLGDHVVRAKYHWDAYTNAMLMSARVLGTLGMNLGPGGPYDSYFFAPIPNSIAFNENLFGLSLLYAPFLLVSRNPLFAYNAVLLLSLSLSSYFTFLLVRRLTGSVPAAAIAGLAFPYCPYAFFEMGRIQLVATQWIPLTFLFLHRAVEERRARDIAGVGLAYVLQVGTCLYYAMFMLPLLGFAGAWFLLQQRPDKRFFVRLSATGVATAALIGLTIAPYFSARKNFDLTRSEDFAGGFDGKLSFFANVAPTNRTLTFLHHEPETEHGAHEEIAFPGFTIALFAFVALVVSLVRALLRLPPGTRLRTAAKHTAYLLVGAGLCTFATLAARSMLAGALCLLPCAALWQRFGRGHERPKASALVVYACTLLLATALFLGLTPLEYGGAPVRGLYYYLHTYAPGWNGIRKISRQAVMTSFLFVVLAGYGAAWLLGRLGNPLARTSLTCVALLLVGYEFREAPVPLEPVLAGKRVPSAYRFIAAQPGEAPVAVVPAGEGRKVFRGPPGQAYINYLSVHHGRRTLNGKSSFIPPVTRMFNLAQARLPTEQSTRILRQLGTQFVLIHTWDLPQARANHLISSLRADGRNYRLAYQDGPDYVFELLPRDDEPTGHLETPPIPDGTTEVPRSELSLSASVLPEHAHLAADGDTSTRWTTRRHQRQGDWFELRLSSPREVAALEIEGPRAVDDAPLGFEISASEDGKTYRTVFRRPKLRIFRDQVFRPKHFVWRTVLPPGTRASHVRITIEDPTPGRWLGVGEIRVWAR